MIDPEDFQFFEDVLDIIHDVREYETVGGFSQPKHDNKTALKLLIEELVLLRDRDLDHDHWDAQEN